MTRFPAALGSSFDSHSITSPSAHSLGSKAGRPAKFDSTIPFRCPTIPSRAVGMALRRGVEEAASSLGLALQPRAPSPFAGLGQRRSVPFSVTLFAACSRELLFEIFASSQYLHRRSLISMSPQGRNYVSTHSRLINKIRCILCEHDVPPGKSVCRAASSRVARGLRTYFTLSSRSNEILSPPRV